MQPAVDEMAIALDGVSFGNPITPIVANCTGEPLTLGEQVKGELLHQLCNCVQWRKSVNYMVDSGVSNFIEFGPGRVLSSLVKRMYKNAHVIPVNDFSSIQTLTD